jgi:hypothetical protein
MLWHPVKFLPAALPGAAAVWNNLANAAPRVFNIAPVAGNNVHVKMKYCLAGGRANVSPDVVTVGAKFCLQQVFYLTDKHTDRPVFFSRSVKVGFNVSFWYNQGMPLTDRAAIVKG